MTSKFRRLEFTHGGDTYLVVGRHRIPPRDRGVARALVQRLAARASPLQLERLAADLVPFPPRSFAHALEIISDALATGRLVAVRDESEPMLFDEEDIIDLHDLIDPDARDDPYHPIDPTPAEPELTWLSFEVVDDRGRRLEGGYVCTIDGSPEEGPLAQEEHAYTELRLAARAELELKFLDLSPEDRLGPVYPDGLEPDGGSGGTEDSTDHIGPFPDGLIPPDHVVGTTTFEVVDGDGRPFDGEYEVRGGTTTSGTLAGRVEVPESTAPLELELRGLAPALLDTG